MIDNASTYRASTCQAPAYQAWTWEAVRDRIIEAAETLRASPRAYGPRMAKGAFGDMVHEHLATEYDRAPSRRKILSPGALSRMEQTWDWINACLDEKARKLLYDYGFIRSRKGVYLQAYLEKNDLVRRTFERRIQKACQAIADNLNRKRLVRLGDTLDAVSEEAIVSEPTKAPSRNYAMHWMAEDGRPRVDAGWRRGGWLRGGGARHHAEDWRSSSIVNQGL